MTLLAAISILHDRNNFYGKVVATKALLSNTNNTNESGKCYKTMRLKKFKAYKLFIYKDAEKVFIGNNKT